MKYRNSSTGESRKRQIDERPQQASVSGPLLVLLSAGALGILTVGNALILDGVLGRFQLLWLVIMLICETASLVGIMLVWPQLRPPVRWHGVEILGATAVGAVFLAHAIYLTPASLMPVSFSVDCAHQHLLVNYIYQHDALPEDVEYLGFYDDYPVGPSALAALTAQAMDLLPVRTMHPLAVFFVAAQCVIVHGILIELLPRRPISEVIAVSAVLLIFTLYQYSVEVFTHRFYSNMIMGDLIILLGLWISIVGKKLHPLLTSGIIILLAFGCLNSYPAWLPFLIIPFVASTLADRRLSIRRRLTHLGATLVLTGLLIVLTLIDQWDFLTWFAPARGRALIPSWKSLGGAFFFLVSLGLGSLVRSWKDRSELILFLLADLACVLALYTAGVTNLISLYVADKTFYFNAFVFTILAGLGLNLIRETLGIAWSRGRKLAYVVVPLLGVLTLLLVNIASPAPDTYPITIDEYRIAYHVAHELPDSELVYLVRNRTVFYWMYGSILNQTDDLKKKCEQWAAERPTYESWSRGEQSAARAIVSDVSTLSRNGQWRILFRSGDSALIERIS